jgi:hypothetical protein
MARAGSLYARPALPRAVAGSPAPASVPRGSLRGGAGLGDLSESDCESTEHGVSFDGVTDKTNLLVTRLSKL